MFSCRRDNVVSVFTSVLVRVLAAQIRYREKAVAAVLCTVSHATGHSDGVLSRLSMPSGAYLEPCGNRKHHIVEDVCGDWHLQTPESTATDSRG